LLSVNDEWQVLERHRLNNEFAVTTDLVIPRLTNAVSFGGSFAANGDEQYFRIDVPAGQNLLIRLNDADQQGANELYVRFGALPTRGTFDFRSTLPGQVNQQVLIPAAAPGAYYILVRGDSVPGSGNFTIQTIASHLNVTSVTPGRYGQNASAVLTVAGAGFDATAVAELVAAGGTAYRAASVTADSFTQLTATFDLSSVPVGIYSVRISSPSWGTNTLAEAFEVLPTGAAKLVTNLIVPSQMGYHVPATIYVEYSNVGNAAMPAPLLVLTATQNGLAGAFLTLQPTRLVEGFWTSAQPEGFSSSIQILANGDTAGVLQPGESRRVPVYYAGWQQPWNFSYPPMNWNLGVLSADDTNVVNWAALKTNMQPASISTDAWDALWASFTAQVGMTWGDYVRMLDDNASYLGRLGDRVEDVGQLLSFEFMQADGLSPLRSLAGSTDASVPAPGLPLAFTRSFAEPISQRFALGSLGRGWSHNWQYSLQQAADGTVTVLGPGGSRRTFQPDSRNSNNYFSQPGDHAALTPLGGGVFTLQEKSGLLYAFQSDGKVNYVQDLNGNRITASYSGNQLAQLTHSSGQYLQLAYNGAGRIQSVTDQLGRQTLFGYDAANEHLLSAQYCDGRSAAYAYNLTPGAAQHALTQTTFPDGTHRYFICDVQGRLSRTSCDGNDQAVAFTYDTAGKVTATDALGGSSKFCFDHRGLLVKTENALNNAVHLAFDDYFNLARLTDPAGRSYAYAYDGKGNLTQSTDPLGHASRFTYQSALNRLASVTDANANATRYAYDAHGNLQSIAYADGSREGWACDALGNATAWTNRRSRPISYAYNTSGQLTNKVFADGSRAIYAYDPRGNLTNATTLDSGLGTLDYSVMAYDASDRLANITSTGGKRLSFTYDTAGRRASSVDQLGHRLAYTYDAAGRLARMTNELGQLVVLYGYDAAGRLAMKTVGNGVFTTCQYDPAGQLLNLTNFLANGTVLSSFAYAYDSRGRRTAMRTLDGQWTYEYDDLGQLTHAVFASTAADIPSQNLTYVYDALGNRVQTIENGVTTQYIANNLNQYVRVGATNYVFDADGSLVQEITPQGTNTFVYNDENRLVGVRNAAGNWQYVYDALGNRVATTENGATKRFVIDPIGLGNVVGEYDGTGNLLAHYDHALGLLSRTDAAGNPAYYTFDAIGNVQQLVTSAGAIANAYAYAPFGAPLRRTEALPNPFQFVGQFGITKEGNGFEFMRARVYGAHFGRFITQDPIGLDSGDINPYRYCFGAPTDFVDPTGFLTLGVTRILPNGQIRTFLRPGLPGPIQRSNRVHEGVHRTQLALNQQRVHSTAYLERQAILAEIAAAHETGIDQYPYTDYLSSRLGLWEFWDMTGVLAGGNRFNNETWSSIRPFIPPAQTGSSGNSSSPYPVDPNAKTGPAGFGTNGFITASGTLAYRVDFENFTNASAPAQQVVITDQLSGNLDWSTFRLAEVGFGDQLVIVPPNTAHFETNVLMSYLGTNFEVQIEAGIQLGSGQAYATFRSIDPATSLPPPVNIGFLPPEDGTGRGRGHVSYSVSANASLATGAQIRNVAQISFDNQPAIATNQKDPHDPSQGTDPAKECLNTIDATPPASHVLPLPATTNRASFLVEWTGQDDPNGSGVAGYSVYVSDNSGPWTLWQNNTTNTSATFAAQLGHCYGFYSVASDNVGHTQLAPATPDAETCYGQTRPTVVVVPPSIATNAGARVVFTAQADGSPPLRFQWRFNGAKRNGATNSTLVLSNVQSSAAGSYSVVVTNSYGSVTSAVAVLKVDGSRPTITITKPKPNQRTYSEMFTATGTASDTVSGVAQVRCQLNSAPWQLAAGSTNWQKTLILMPGPNTFRAFAVDAAGNISTTNSVLFSYVVSNLLTVATTGQGKLTPNYSNAFLEVGQPYTVTASGVNGHAFASWVVSTNWSGGVTSTAPALHFIMQSNLTLRANFVDVTKPTIGISSPVANQRWSNAVFTVKGTAKDNVHVSNVWCLTNGVWGSANLGSGGTNWAINVTPVPGTNTVKAYAEDAAGNKSLTNSVKFIYVVSDRLLVQATGPCTLSPNYSNAVLEIGKSYSMTATAGKGFVLSNWVVTVSNNLVIVTNTPRLTFIMQSNLVLQANIIPNPFIPLAGSYYGLVYDLANGIQQQSAGFFSGTLLTAGSLSGKLQMGGRSDSFTGQFDVGGRLRKTVTRTGSTPLGLDLQLTNNGTLSGTVSNVAWTSRLDAYRAVFNAVTNPCPYAGRYTLAIPGEEGQPGYPEGSGCGLVTVDKGGVAVLSGWLAEGTAMSQSVPVSQEGDWPLYVSLYSGKGLLMAWLRFTLPAGLTNTAANWIKPANSASTYYRGGFTNEFAATGSAYMYVNTNRVLALTNGVMVFSGGNLAAPVTNELLLTATNRFFNLSTNPMGVTVNVTNGYLSGWFKVPGAGKTNQFKGVLLQEQNRGDGYFLGTNQSGRVLLGPAP
jgi:RHS repeat-associated protein